MNIHYDAGTYRATVVGQSLGESSKGNAQVIIKIRPFAIKATTQLQDDSDRFEGLDGECYERTIFLTITSNTVDWVCKRMMAIGLEVDEWEQVNLGRPDSVTIMSTDIIVECKHKPHYKNTGEMQETWDIPTAGEAGALDDSGVSNLQAEFGQQLKDAKAKAEERDASDPQGSPPDVAPKANVQDVPNASDTPTDDDGQGDDLPF